MKESHRQVQNLLVRVLLLAAALVIALVEPAMLDFAAAPSYGTPLLVIIWLMFAAQMLYRLIPNKKIALGARKHFAGSYMPVLRNADCVGGKRIRLPLGVPQQYGYARDAEGGVPYAAAKKRLHKGAAKVAVFWVALNIAVFAALFLNNLLTPAAAVVFVLVYSVFDEIFILFFCPFRTFFMRNDCCATCRIYNWDYFMICTPLILFPSVFSYSLLLLSVAVLIRWEWAVYRNPHFFLRESNLNLCCEKCKECRDMHLTPQV